MDPKNENSTVRQTPQYALYQRHNFWKSNEGENPLFNTGAPFLSSAAQSNTS